MAAAPPPAAAVVVALSAGGGGRTPDGTPGGAASGLPLFVCEFVGMTLAWTAMFYALVATQHRWLAQVPESTKSHENDRYYIARNVIGIIHAVVISAITVPAFFVLAGASEDVKFAWSSDVGTCRPPPAVVAELGEFHSFVDRAVAFAGLLFTTFTVGDLLWLLIHGLATADFVVHHLAFLAAGLVLRLHCSLPYNASMLLAMEVSTPFLNYMLFFRHRGAAYKAKVNVAGVAFVLLYVVFRLGINTYGAVMLVMRGRSVMPGVPEWQAWFLLAAVGVGAAVQFFWFPAIARIFAQGLLSLFRGGDGDNGEDPRIAAPAGPAAGGGAAAGGPDLGARLLTS